MEQLIKPYGAIADSNPWKGLNFYTEGEVLYGRNDEISSLSLYITNNTQTVLYGKSGIGKSSIVNAGVFPLARREGLFPIPIRLKHDPESAYMEQIREAFAQSGIGISEKLPAVGQQESLWEFLHRHTFFNTENNETVRPLVVLDQFEEIFTLQSDERRKLDFFSQLGDLLNEVKPQYIVEATQTQAKPGAAGSDTFTLDFGAGTTDEAHDYVAESLFNFVFVIREDFLAHLERYTRYIPVMKSNRYALLPINEEQAKDIIMRPVPGLVDIAVAKLIIEKVTGRSDFSLGDAPEIEVDAAVLSLYLSRLFLKKGEGAISAELVNQFSDDIIKDFYEESVADLPTEEIERLEDQLITYDGRRNNVSRSDLFSEGVSPVVVRTLVEERKLLRQFSYQDDMRVEFMHDILCPIVNARIERREQERARAEEAARLERERQALEAQAAAEREQHEREKAEIERKNRRKLRRVVGYAAAAILLVATILFSRWLWYGMEFHKCYAQFENRDGWPVGVGDELDDESCKHTPLYYRLSCRGLNNRSKGHYTRVEIMSSNDVLPADCRLSLPELEWCDSERNDDAGKTFNGILRRVAMVRYVVGDDGVRISKMELWSGSDINRDTLLMVASYFHKGENDAWLNFYNAQGGNLRIRDCGIDRVKVSWDPDRLVESLTFYDNRGVKREISSAVCGYLWRRHVDGGGTLTVRRYALDQYGRPTPDAPYNTVVTRTVAGGATETTYWRSLQIPSDSLRRDPNARLVLCERGYSRMLAHGDTVRFFLQDSLRGSARHMATQVIERGDARGNITCITTTGDTTFGFAPVVNYTYNNCGLLTLKEQLTSDGKRGFSTDSTRICRWEYGYDDQAVLNLERRLDTANREVYLYRCTCEHKDSCDITRTETKNLVDSASYVMQVDSVIPGHRVTAFFGDRACKHAVNRSVLPGYSPGCNNLMVHREIVDSIQTDINGIQQISRKFYNTTGPLPTELDQYGRATTYFRRIEELDGDNNLVGLRLEDSDGRIIKNMMYFYQNGELVGRAARGISGQPVRCDQWEIEGYMYYKLCYYTDPRGDYADVLPVDEWGHTSALFDGSDYIRFKRMSFKDKSITIKYINKIISINDEFDQILYNNADNLSFVTIPFVHIHLRQGESLPDISLLDGDRIVMFGRWRYPQPVTLFEKEWNSYMGNAKAMKVGVLRPIRNSLEYKLLDLSCSDVVRETINCHFVELTKDEMLFMNRFVGLNK